MQIDIIPYQGVINKEKVKGKTVVVIDVLRATSVMIHGLKNGAECFIPVTSVEEAKEKAEKIKGKNVLLAGERNTRIIPGFDLGNSPQDYSAENVSGKTIILTTTNGTRALNKVKGADKILIGAFLNASAVVEEIKNDDDVFLVCSGTNNTFSLDDGMCAAMIIDLLTEKIDVELSDFAILMLKAYRSGKDNLRQLLNDCYHLNLLINRGFESDVNFCLQVDIYDIVPRIKDGEIR
jgi:2-phosphosulfolactate phosphatase